MKFIRGLTLLFIGLMLSWTVEAQDIHYSQYHLSPLTTNPAMTGAYEGTFRIGGLYREQWGSILENQFQTPSIYLDAPIIRGFGKNDWIGIGVHVLNDRAGTAALTNLTAMASLAYHLGIGKKANTYLSLGAQGGYVQKRLDQSKLIFKDQFVDGVLVQTTSQDLSNISADNVSYPDFQLGAVLNSYITSKLNMYLGFSAYHITSPEDAFMITNELATRMQANAGMNIDISNKATLSPRVLFQTQAGATETVPQLMLGYHLNPEKSITFNIGAGYRVADAIIPMVGLDIAGFKVGVAYDVNVSDLSSSTNNRGGWEIAAAYTAKVYKNPVVKPVLFCPRF